MAFYSSFILVVLTSCRWQCWHLQSILLYFAKYFCVWKYRVPVKHRAPQLYWSTVLPYTKIQKAISDLILQPAVEQGSFEANTLKETIELCERPGNKGEEKYCTTSLESLIDFSTSKLGTRNVEAISTELLEKGVIKSLRKFTVLPGVKKLGGDEAVSCHKQRYPL